MEKQTYSKLFIIFLTINITCLLVSNIIAIKTIQISGIIFTAADILFPITYILNDIFTEVYGLKKAKLIIWLSFFANLLMVILFWIAILLPQDVTFSYQRELETILSMTPRVLIASFVAFIVGSLTNSIVMETLKNKTKGKYLALRTITSTIVGEGLDSILFVSIVFLGTMEFTNLLQMAINMFGIKVLLEIILTPVTYQVINFVKRKETPNI